MKKALSKPAIYRSVIVLRERSSRARIAQIEPSQVSPSPKSNQARFCRAINDGRDNGPRLFVTASDAVSSRTRAASRLVFLVNYSFLWMRRALRANIGGFRWNDRAINLGTRSMKAIALASASRDHAEES